MNKVIVSQLEFLGISFLITLLILRFYRRRRFPPSDQYSTFDPRF